jgi:RNA polymerase sigma factor (TIGR02999 family)
MRSSVGTKTAATVRFDGGFTVSDTGVCAGAAAIPIAELDATINATTKVLRPAGSAIWETRKWDEKRLNQDWDIKGPSPAAMGHSPDITALLVEWDRGGGKGDAALVEAVYGELRRLAAGYLHRERRDHSLSPTALVHEAYLKLIDQRRTHWQNRAHFFAIAAHLMRRILVDHARAHGAVKRGKGDRVPFEEGAGERSPIDVDVLALDRALERLADLEVRQARIVELRFFGGLTVEETAAVLDVAPITVKRDWALAKVWLYRQLQGAAP